MNVPLPQDSAYQDFENFKNNQRIREALIRSSLRHALNQVSTRDEPRGTANEILTRRVTVPISPEFLTL